NTSVSHNECSAQPPGVLPRKIPALQCDWDQYATHSHVRAPGQALVAHPAMPAATWDTVRSWARDISAECNSLRSSLANHKPRSLPGRSPEFGSHRLETQPRRHPCYFAWARKESASDPRRYLAG